MLSQKDNKIVVREIYVSL